MDIYTVSASTVVNFDNPRTIEAIKNGLNVISNGTVKKYAQMGGLVNEPQLVGVYVAVPETFVSYPMYVYQRQDESYFATKELIKIPTEVWQDNMNFVNIARIAKISTKCLNQYAYCKASGYNTLVVIVGTRFSYDGDNLNRRTSRFIAVKRDYGCLTNFVDARTLFQSVKMENGEYERQRVFSEIECQHIKEASIEFQKEKGTRLSY